VERPSDRRTKRETIDRIKTAVTQKIPEFSSRRLRERAQPAWHEAYALRGAGSTFKRCQRINNIYAEYVPVPDARGDKLAFKFLSEIKEIVMQAIDEIEQEVNDAN